MLKILQELTEQRSADWHNARKGWITASQVHKLMGKTPTTDTAITYLDERVYERATGLTLPQASSAAIEWGNTHEEEAIIAAGYKPERIGFKASEIEYFGGSPDGLHFEIKCPYNPLNHFRYFIGEEIPKEYYWQMQALMFAFNVQSWEFISYDPRQVDKFKLFRTTVARNQADIDRMIERVNLGLTYIKNKYEAL